MFASYKAQDLLTYSRSTTGTYIGSDGLLKTAAVDEARIEYDGSDLQGLLLEPISTNQWTRSTTFTGQWSHNGTLTGGQSPDPAGGNSAFLWVDTDTSNDQDMLNANFIISSPSSTNRWTSSVFVKKPSSAPAGTEFEFWNFFDGASIQNLFTRWEFDANGVISLTSSGNGGVGTSVPFHVGYDTLANGWYRIYQTCKDENGSNTVLKNRIYGGRRNTGYTGSLLVYGPQLEQNHMVTSYIPTSGTAGTRQPDKAYIDIDQFGVKQDRGTFVAEINNLKWATATSTYPRVIEMGNTTDNSDRLIVMLVNGPENIIYSSIITDGSNQGDITYQDFANSVDVGPFNGKVALRYDETSQRTAKDGVLIGSEDATGNIVGQRPYRTRLALRAEANTATGEGDDIRFHIKSLKYYPRKLNDADMFSETDNTIQNGLTFNLDATAYTNYSTSNLLSPYPWTVGTGSETFYDQNGSTDENERVVDTNPFNDTDIVWQSPSNDATSNADGGWNTPNFAVDISKTYRFSVWTRKKDIQGNGRFYLGSNGYNSSGVNIGILNRTAGATNTNFYFTAPRFDDGSISPSVSLGDWVLVVGHIWPEGSGTGSIHPDSGIYETDGTKKTSYPGEKDGVWQTGTTQSKHRCYQYYSTTTNEKQQWWAPRVDVLDGNEPTISELINGAGRNWELTSQSSVGLNGSYWDDDTSGTFVFDGTDDYIKLPTSISIYNSSYTFEAWINADTAIGQHGILGDYQYDWFGFRLNSSNKLFIQHRQTNSDINSLTGVSNVGTSWAHVAVVFDINAGMRLYLNGELDASNTNTSYFGLDSTTRGPQYIGRNDKSSFGSNTPYFDGKIARLLGYTKALTATEIQKSYNTSKARFGL